MATSWPPPLSGTPRYTLPAEPRPSLSTSRNRPTFFPVRLPTAISASPQPNILPHSPIPPVERSISPSPAQGRAGRGGRPNLRLVPDAHLREPVRIELGGANPAQESLLALDHPIGGRGQVARHLRRDQEDAVLVGV